MFRIIALASAFALAAALPQLPTEADLESTLESVDEETGLLTELPVESADPSALHHLYFHALDLSIPSDHRCGQVDAAQFMPPTMFATGHKLALRAYVEATVKFYKVPVLANAVKYCRARASATPNVGAACRASRGPAA